MEEQYESAFDMPEETTEQIIGKISSLAWQIRDDWSDPRDECGKIVELCNKLKPPQELEKTIIKLKDDNAELREKLQEGRHYLMGVDPKDLTVEDALETFGFGRNGLK